MKKSVQGATINTITTTAAASNHENSCRVVYDFETSKNNDEIYQMVYKYMDIYMVIPITNLFQTLLGWRFVLTADNSHQKKMVALARKEKFPLLLATKTFLR